MRHVGLVQLRLELEELLLPALVEGDLRRGGASRLLELLVQVVQFAAEGSAGLVGAGAAGALAFQLLIKFLQPVVEY